MSQVKSAHIQIFGFVQGVYYRGSALKKANELNLGGFTRNCPDGSVEILATGEEEKIKQLIEWCRQGPPAAKVSNVVVKWQETDVPNRNFKVM